jgi:hypothetical protein
MQHTVFKHATTFSIPFMEDITGNRTTSTMRNGLARVKKDRSFTRFGRPINYK